MPTRETCVSTGTSRRPNANSSTHAAVLRPTPGSATRYSRACASGTSGSQSSEGSCTRTARARTRAWVGFLELNVSVLELNVSEPAGLDRPAFSDGGEDRLDALRLDLGDASRPDRLLDLVHGRAHHGVPRREALAQAQVGDVSVAVVGALREHGQHQLGDRVAVRPDAGNPVYGAEPFAHAHHARARGGRHCFALRRSRSGSRRRGSAGQSWPVEAWLARASRYISSIGARGQRSPGPAR